MTIGQRLSAGSKMMGSTQAREAGGRISVGDHQASDLCRPFHGLATLVTFLIPALKRWAIFTSSAFADDVPPRLFGQSRPLPTASDHCPLISINANQRSLLVQAPFSYAFVQRKISLA